MLMMLRIFRDGNGPYIQKFVKPSRGSNRLLHYQLLDKNSMGLELTLKMIR